MWKQDDINGHQLQIFWSGDLTAVIEKDDPWVRVFILIQMHSDNPWGPLNTGRILWSADSYERQGQDGSYILTEHSFKSASCQLSQQGEIAGVIIYIRWPSRATNEVIKGFWDMRMCLLLQVNRCAYMCSFIQIPLRYFMCRDWIHLKYKGLKLL